MDGNEITEKQARMLLAMALLPVTWPFVLAAWLFFRPAVGLVERIRGVAPARPDTAALMKDLGRKYAGSADPLLRGDRRAAAEAAWPTEAYPSLYIDVPEDLERPAAMDGRLFEGVGVSYLAEREIVPDDIADAAHAGKVAQRAFVLSSIGILALVAFLLTMAGSYLPVGMNPYAAAAGIAEVNADIAELRKQTVDPLHVSWPDMKPIELSAPAEGGLVSGLLAGAKAFGFDALHVVLVYVVPILVTIASILSIAWALGKAAPAGYLSALLARKGGRYAMPTKDSFVRFQHRADLRKRNLRGYAKQLRLATGHQALDPLIGLGKATGALRHRGDQLAPLAGQTLCMDYSSLFQHMVVFGGTGENKTAGILKPIFRQLLDARSPAGNPLGFFVIDAKAVLWRDFMPKIERAGRLDDVRVIGFGVDQWGVDLLAGLDPTQAAGVLRTIMDQQGGGGKDPFWANNAVDIFRHLLVLAEAYRYTPGGQQEWLDTGIDPYSISWVFKAICSPSIVSDATMNVLRSFADDQWDEYGSAIHSATLWSSITWLQNVWATMADNTKSGVVGQVSQILDGLASRQDIRDRFASGRPHPNAEAGRRILPIREALDGRIVMVAVSSLEHGTAAKSILMFLKTGLFRAARLRELEIGSKACQAKPCVYVADEVQEFVSGDTSGLSDGTFWNVARSSGVAGIIATQTMSSLVMALGNEKAAENLVAQFRSKVILRVEDCSASRGESMTTLEMAQALSGRYERCRSFEAGQYESLDAQFAVTGWHPVLSAPDGKPVRPAERRDIVVEGMKAAFLPMKFSKESVRDPFRPAIDGVGEKQSLYEVDPRYLDDDARVALKDGQAWLQHNMQVAWRREDQHRQTVTTGIETEPGVTPSDFLSMGRFFAYAHLQRAGARVHDIIELEPDYEVGVPAAEVQAAA